MWRRKRAETDSWLLLEPEFAVLGFFLLALASPRSWRVVRKHQVSAKPTEVTYGKFGEGGSGVNDQNGYGLLSHLGRRDATCCCAAQGV